MKKKRDEVLVGLVIAVAVIVTVLGSLWLARGGLSKGYPLYAKFPWGAGLKQGQPVLLVGVNVGYVDEVDLHQDGILVTTLRIQKAYKVPVTSTAAVVPNGIFGDMAIAVTPSRPDTRSFKAGDTVPVGPSSPGIAELIRILALATFPRAALGRGVAGVRGKSLIVNLPGSPSGARDGLDALDPIIQHACDVLSGKVTEHTLAAVPAR